MGLPYDYWTAAPPAPLRPMTPRISHPFYSSPYSDTYPYPPPIQPMWGVPAIPASSNLLFTLKTKSNDGLGKGK
ncbi:uncharacterized protein I206_107616 [Kwoniella pini CBS 10737]|uniref:Uncharacterized protein n=1 Tax=Kwoniella pini CBS 10737 TaxID=1296096 RepID=A0A1B9HXT3_9TREE|nr:uncharacterized protein I206_05949 [Kwoniella pini CBS 10737]OCF48082.1 hypothetical protein I206_05949 [Kwoniella pini CBS 10737]